MKILLALGAGVVALAVFAGVGLVVLHTRIDDGLSRLTGEPLRAGQYAAASNIDGCLEGWLWGGLHTSGLIKHRVEEIGPDPVDPNKAEGTIADGYWIVTRVYSLFAIPVRTKLKRGDGGTICDVGLVGDRWASQWSGGRWR